MKLLTTYKNLSKPIKASIWFIISNIIIKGISFITLPIFSRLLSTSEYGIVSVYSSWISIITILTTLTIWGGVFNVAMVKFKEKYKEMISSFQGLAISITLVYLLISLIFINQISVMLGLSKLLVICMYLEILAQIPFNLWSTAKRYKFEYKSVILITIIISGLSPLLGVIAVKNTVYKVEAKIISNLIVQFIIGLVLFIHNQRDGKKFFNNEYWKFGFKFNVVLIPHYLSTQVLNQSDRVMISSICGSSYAGIYSVAYNFAFLLSIITNGINSSLTPHIYESLRTGKTSQLKKQTSIVIIFVAIISLGLICFAPDLFKFMLPESYYPALKAIPPVTIGAFFLFLYPLFGSIEFYYEKNKYVTIASVIGAILNILLNYIFINIFGFMAAAYTTLFCYMCFSICHYIFMKKILKQKNKQNDIYDIKTIVIISLALMLISLLILFLYDYMIVRWCFILIILCLTFIFRKKFINVFTSLKK